MESEKSLRLIYSQDTFQKPKRKCRVLLVITRLTIGGDTNVVLDIANHLNSQPNFEAHLAAGPVSEHEIDLTHLAHKNEIPTKVIPSMVNKIDPWLNLKAVAQLRRVIIQGKYDIVHTHSSVAGVIGRLAALLANVNIIVHHVHGWGMQKDMSRLNKMLYLGLERICTRFTDCMIAVSKPTIEKGLANHICTKDKFALIYNGIPLERFRQPIDEKQVRFKLGLNPDNKIVGMIGRLDEQKNPLDFIRAASLVVNDYPDVQFLIAGDGSLRTECENLIDALNLRNKFFLLGFRDDIDKIIPMFTLTVMSSLWEGLPVVFQEAMSAGKPIVANDVDGASDVVINGETGFLVTPHQPQEMAERILFLLKNDSLCEEMSHTARKRSEYFSNQRMVKEIESLYRDFWSLSV